MKVQLLLLIVVSSSAFSQNLITNNASFESGLTGWEYGVASYDGDTPDASFETISEGYNGEGACEVKVKISTSSGNLNEAYLMSKGIKVKKGKKYRVGFRIKSSRRDDKVMVSVGSGTQSDLRIMKDRLMKFVGDNTWRHISFTFEANKEQADVDFKNMLLLIGFNHRFGTFYVDDFSIKPI